MQAKEEGLPRYSVDWLKPLNMIHLQNILNGITVSLNLIAFPLAENQPGFGKQWFNFRLKSQ